MAAEAEEQVVEEQAETVVAEEAAEVTDESVAMDGEPEGRERPTPEPRGRAVGWRAARTEEEAEQEEQDSREEAEGVGEEAADSAETVIAEEPAGAEEPAVGAELTEDEVAAEAEEQVVEEPAEALAEEELAETTEEPAVAEKAGAEELVTEEEAETVVAEEVAEVTDESVAMDGEQEPEGRERPTPEPRGRAVGWRAARMEEEDEQEERDSREDGEVESEEAPGAGDDAAATEEIGGEETGEMAEEIELDAEELIFEFEGPEQAGEMEWTEAVESDGDTDADFETSNGDWVAEVEEDAAGEESTEEVFSEETEAADLVDQQSVLDSEELDNDVWGI